jgi:hypothetical protein
MRSGIWNVGFGLAALVAGASGRYVLPGTSSPVPLMVVGVLLAGFGLFQMLRSRGQ